MANLHSAGLVGQHLGEKHRDDANRRVDARHGERVHRSKALDENGTILGTKVLTRKLEEDVDANGDESALEIGCKSSAGSKSARLWVHLLPRNRSIKLPFLMVVLMALCMSSNSELISSSV